MDTKLERIEFDTRIPIYIQIMDYIKRQIVIGELSCGVKLPSVREMATVFKVNPNTLQRVYQELEREGITFTQRGLGTFVSERLDIVLELQKDMANGLISQFISGMKTIGYSNERIIKEVTNYLYKEDTK